MQNSTTRNPLQAGVCDVQSKGRLWIFSILPGSTFMAPTGAVKGTTSGSHELQPWLVGLTAVVVFLFIVFLLMIINRVLCYKKHRDEEDTQGHQADARLTPNGYENEALQEQPEEQEEGVKPNKTTSL
ncbi:PREDICTED: small integral membrane protein 24 isoform X2 [Crocodylus porosus]|uniref:small integral membrane protein 24 isoform X2 n=1 Tax=Crocodylus porosus TaxID=8502 RepID=UPI00093D40F9|nr:PREDICTED: small integral membrane protein 24 isoform X2 [Crocodylus porosus]